MRSLLLHVSAETLRTDCGPAHYAMGMASALDAEVRAPVFQLDAITSYGMGRQFAAEASELVEDQHRVALEKATELREAAKMRQLSVRVDMERAVSFGLPDRLCDLAKLHDLTVGGVDDGGLPSDRQLAQALLFRSGRPVLVVPSDYRREFSVERVVIAWDFSAPAARAMADALPLLRRAADVIVVTMGDDKSFGTQLGIADVIEALAVRGVTAGARDGCRNGAAIGDALQDFALQERADLLVMGAFGHSRLSEFILGGATRHVLENLKLPVMLSH